MKTTAPRHRIARLLLAGLALLTTGLLAIPAGCGSARRVTPEHLPRADTDSQFTSGQHAFMTHCYQCHPSGAGGLGPALNDKPLPAGLVKYQVRHGLGAMPAFSPQQIPDEELDHLVAYVKALRE